MTQSFSGKVYIVTGASRGIGFATAKLLVESGARVALFARGAGAVADAAASLGAAATAWCPLVAPSATSPAIHSRCLASASAPPAMRQRHEFVSMIEQAKTLGLDAKAQVAAPTAKLAR